MLNPLENWWLRILLRRQFETESRSRRGQPNPNEKIQNVHLQLSFFQGHFTSEEITNLLKK